MTTTSKESQAHNGPHNGNDDHNALITSPNWSSQTNHPKSKIVHIIIPNPNKTKKGDNNKMGIFFEKAEESKYKSITIARIIFSLAAVVVLIIGIINNLNTIYLGYTFLLLALTNLVDAIDAIISKLPKKRLYFSLLFVAVFMFMFTTYIIR